VKAELGPIVTRIDASARAGSDNRLGLRGTLAPGDLDLRADGRVDLALLDPLLTALGRQAAGQATLDARIAGDPRAPRLDGTLRLSNGAIWDRTIGLALTEVSGRILLAGDTLRLDGFSARAGTGSLSLAGSVGVLAPAIPVDLRLVARDASPLQRDLLNVQGDGDLRLSGQALGRLDLAGAVQLSRVEIRLPERLPASVVTLEVREVGQRRAGSPDAPPRVPWRPDLGLDLLLSAPRGVSVQGRGVDAELGGEVRLRGTLEAPQVTGGFDLRRGEYDLAGQTLRFSRGRLGFEGAAGLDPTLDLEARKTVAGTTAILAVQGTTRAPRIDLRGEPEMPQDEVLSRLLFGVAGGRLSPWQATRVGLAAASLAGIEIGDLDVLGRIRGGLGLGRQGANASGGGILQGGRQLSERVYLGTRQGERAGEPQGVLRIEATPSIRLEADVGPVGGTRAGAAFEIEY
jgi:translocation and assembly module TamB